MKGLSLILLIATAQLFSQDSIEVKIPRKALTYSIVPGGGQLYNQKPFKAALILSAQIWMLYQFQINRTFFKKWDGGDMETKEFYRENRNKYAWRSIFVYLYNLTDALVDSHLSGFDQNENETVTSDSDVKKNNG